MRDEPLSESFKTYYAMGYPEEPPAARSKPKNEDKSFRADLRVMPKIVGIINTMIEEKEQLKAIADKECELKYLQRYDAMIKVLNELKEKLNNFTA